MQSEDKIMVGTLQLLGVVREHPGVRVLDAVSLDLRPGQVHALMGENGSGKTTLIRILFGLEQPDAGEIRMDGRRVTLQGPAEALALGIGLAPPAQALAGSLTALENVILGAEPVRRGMLTHARAARERARTLAEIYGLRVEWNARLAELDEGMRRRVAILKALYRECRVLLLDEPLEGLNPWEAGEILQALRSLAAEGRSVLITSRAAAQLQGGADQSIFLHQGRAVGAEEAENPRVRTPSAQPSEPGASLLMVQNLAVAADGRRDHRVRNVSLTVRRGEIVCLAGFAGDGQDELALAVAGRSLPESGRVLLGTFDITHATQRARSALGLGFLTADRRRGWIEGLSLAENLALDAYFQQPFVRGGFLRKAALNAHAKALAADLDLPLEGSAEPAGAGLSDAACKKAMLARAMDTGPTLLVVVEPGQGLEPEAAQALYDRLKAWRDAGHAVLLASSDAAEILELSDRILILREGAAVAELDARHATAEELALYRSGAGREGLF